MIILAQRFVILSFDAVWIKEQHKDEYKWILRSKLKVKKYLIKFYSLLLKDGQ